MGIIVSRRDDRYRSSCAPLKAGLPTFVAVTVPLDVAVEAIRSGEAILR